MKQLDLLSDSEQAAFEDRAFRDWMAKVEAVLRLVVEMGTDDLNDISYRDYFDAGFAPREVAAAALEEAGAEIDWEGKDA